MELRLLGPLELIDDEERAVGLPGGKPRRLLALLGLEAGRVVSVDRIVDVLWGERPPATAGRVVENYVSRLRKLFPEGVLERRGPGWALRLDERELDVRRFERLQRDGTAAAAEGRLQVASALLSDALALWRGPPLADVEYESFARREIGRLEELRLVTLEQRLEVELALGRHAELVAELELLVGEHPHRERLCALLMLALYRSGRQTDALRVYREERAALDELGLEPGAALRELERQILTQDALLDLPRRRLLARAFAGRVPLPGPLVPASPFPFVGRTVELAALRAALERTERGEGGVLVLAGEAGAGKTRLVREFAHEAAAGGVLVCYGASDAAVATAYQPLLEWLEFLLRVCDEGALRECLGSGGETLSRLVPELSGLTGTQPADGETDRFALQRAVTELLTRMSRVQPLLLVLDDLHWADGETLHLLRRLARVAPEARLLVVTAYRDRGEQLTPEPEDTLTSLSRLDSVSRLSLGNLGAEDVSAFIRGTTGAEPPEELTSAIGELSDGTPLLLCELWRDLLESGAVEVAHTVRLTQPLAELRGPERIGDIVHQRLARVAPETRTLLELAAAAGPQFELAVLAEAAELDRGVLVAAVAEAVEIGLVEELPEPTPAGRFTHELMRRAVYDRITGLRRAELHLRVGEALQHVHQADLSRVLPELAHHFTQAAPVAGVARGVEYNLQAGRAALAAGVFSESAARLQTGLELGIADPRERVRIQGELSYLLWMTERVAEAEALLEESIETATSLGERGLATRLQVQVWAHELWADPHGDPEEYERRARQAIEMFRELGDQSGLANAERLLGRSLSSQGRLSDALAAQERALVHAEAAGDQVARRQVAPSLGMMLIFGPTPAAEGIRRLEELREAYRDDRVLEAVLTRHLSYLYAMAGRAEEALEAVGASSLVLDQLHEGTHSRGYREVAVWARQLAGDRAGAERELTTRWPQLRELDGDTPDQLPLGATYELAMFYCDEGRWKEAADLLAYFGDRVVGEGTSLYIVRARLAAHRGEHDDALRLIEPVVESAERKGAEMLNHRAVVQQALAEVQRAAGNSADADAADARALTLYEAKGNVAAAEPLRSAVGA